MFVTLLQNDHYRFAASGSKISIAFPLQQRLTKISATTKKEHAGLF